MELDYDSLADSDRNAMLVACAGAVGGDSNAIAKIAFETAAAVLERSAKRRNTEQRG